MGSYLVQKSFKGVSRSATSTNWKCPVLLAVFLRVGEGRVGVLDLCAPVILAVFSVVFVRVGGRRIGVLDSAILCFRFGFLLFFLLCCSGSIRLCPASPDFLPARKNRKFFIPRQPNSWGSWIINVSNSRENDTLLSVKSMPLFSKIDTYYFIEFAPHENDDFICEIEREAPSGERVSSCERIECEYGRM